MSAKLISSIVIIALVANSYAFDILQMVKQQENSMKILLDALHGKNQIDPAAVDASACFDYYLEEQAKVGQEYNRQYLICDDNANAARKLVSDQSAGVRNELVQRGNGICSDLGRCEANEDALDFFNCYGNASSVDTQLLYSISTDSNTEVRRLKVEYERIDNDLVDCKAIAYNNYIDNLASTNTHWQECLKNGIYPSEAPETSTTNTTPLPTTSYSEGPTGVNDFDTENYETLIKKKLAELMSHVRPLPYQN